MKKSYQYLMLLLLLSNTILAQETTTEDFENQTEGAISFTSNGQVFDIISQVGIFNIYFDPVPYGWNGTAEDNKFIDNTGTSNANSNFNFAISTQDGALFNVNSLWVFLAESTNTGLNLNVSGSITFEGKLSGETQFTVTQHTSSSFNNTSLGTANGFTFIDFENFDDQNVTNNDIDELVISSTASFNYCSLDAFTWTTVPEVSVFPPTVSTASPTGISGISANLGGNVSNDGGATVTERGVVYSSTSSVPEIGGADVIQESVGNDTGSFQFSATGLNIDTMYYVRAYAINSEGVSYGEVRSFSTQSCDVSFSYSASTYCVNGSNPTPTITGLGGGSFSSTAGLNINSSTGAINLSASTPGTYTVTYTTTGSCPNSSSVDVTINPSDDASFSYAESLFFQEGSSNPIPTVTGLTGGTFTSSPAGLSLDSISGEINLSESASDVYEVSYTTNGFCPNTLVAVITIDDFDGVTFTYTSTSGFLPQDPSGFNLTNNNLVIEDGTAIISDETTFNKVTVKPNAILNLGANLTTANKILFESDITGTGQLDDTNGFSIVAEAEVERFIPEGRRAFRFISPTVTTTSTIYENWQEDGASPTGFGTHITGDGGATNGFDETATNNPSLFIFDNNTESQSGGAAWEAVSNTDVNTLTAGTPYRLLVRGDRNVDLTTNTPTATETVLRAFGDLHFGDFSPTISAFDANFNFVGNPYQATVNSKEITYSGDINSNYIYVWDAQQGSNGSYVTIDMLDGSNTVGSNANEFIQPGQAFFIRNNLNVTTAPSLTFTEASKEVSEEQLATFSTSNYAKLNLQLTSGDNGQVVDAIGLRFSNEFTNEVDDADAGKMGNSGENLALVSGNQLLSIEQRQLPTQAEELPLFINNYQNENYVFYLETEQWDENLTIFIKDAYTDELTPIEAGEEYVFNVDSGIADSSSPFRFSLVFNDETFSDDAFEEQTFSIYPNPAKEQFFVSGIKATAEVSITNLMGQEVMSLTNVNNQESLNVASLSSGVYLVRIKEGDQESLIKIIKE